MSGDRRNTAGAFAVSHPPTSDIDSEAAQIPVVLFAYKRPDHLSKTLACLKENEVPLLYVFCDGPKSPVDERSVRDVHDVVDAIDWCETVVTKHDRNLGLGTSILAGVASVFDKHESVIVFEDDLVCVPGTYRYLRAALDRYRDDERVMSVSAHTHPRVTPSDVVDRPYFDGRFDCLGWGSWRRAWKGIDRDALTLMNIVKSRGIDIRRYGWDVPLQAKMTRTRDIWAIRFTYLHQLHAGLCLKPPVPYLKHAGYDVQATNAPNAEDWDIESLPESASLPSQWPEPVEHPDCARLWQRAHGHYLPKNWPLDWIYHHTPQPILKIAKKYLNG